MYDIILLLRKPVSFMRTLPRFIIVGGQRCGTSLLYDNIIMHPAVRPCLGEETFYFSKNYSKGWPWYRAHFPLKSMILISGEVSSDYLFHPLAPKRIMARLPDVKLIILLRNPVDRAFSHYSHEVSKGREDKPFEDALALEEMRLAGEKDKVMSQEDYVSEDMDYFSYKARGHYADQIIRWFGYFPRNQILILKTEDFYMYPSGVINEVYKFLDLKIYGLSDFEDSTYERDKYKDMLPSTREMLSEYYKPHNEKLYNLIKRDMQW